MFWSMILPLLFSPIFYLMTNLALSSPTFLDICLMTLGSQLCFGFGLNICVFIIKKTTDVFDDNILSLVHVPLVVIAMALPIAFSGMILELLGFRSFFILDVLLSCVSLSVILLNRKFINRHILSHWIKDNLDNLFYILRLLLKKIMQNVLIFRHSAWFSFSWLFER